MHVRELLGVDQRWVPASGPVPADLAFVAEAPSTDEIRTGLPLTGPSGKINWLYAGRYGGLTREGNYVTNWSKVPLSKQDKEEMSAETEAQWTELLEEELAEVAPKTIVALGAYAVRALLGPGYSLHWSNGRAFSRGDDGQVVIPITHPAAGIHKPDFLRDTAQGYAGARAYLRGEQSPVATIDQWKPTGFVDPGFYLDPDVTDVGMDTEGSVESPLCLQYSTDGITAYVIYAWEVEKLAKFRLWLARHRPTIHLHHAVHDAAVLRAMGVDIWQYRVVDTMVLAYNRQDMPLGLKPISKREFSEPMQEYEELVGPYQRVAEQKWRIEAYKAALSYVRFEQQLTPKGKIKMSKGEPVYKWVGEDVQLRLVKHVERQQQMHLDEEKWAETQVGKKPGMDLILVPEPMRSTYAGRDAYVTRRLGPILLERNKRDGLDRVGDLDMSVLPMVDDMEQVGLHVDLERYWEVTGEISSRRQAVGEELVELVRQEGFEGDFNPASDDDVAKFCGFVHRKDGRLGLTKLTPSGKRYSTEGNVLTQLRDEHPFIPLELEFRELSKYENSYLLPLGQALDTDDMRLYHDIRTTTVVSGRFSGRVLTWPARTKLGLKLRSIFTAPPGWKLASWDLSQIEMRIAAALSKDPVLTEVFVRGLDPHTNLASKLFGVPYELVDKLTQRTPSKNVNYGLVYGEGGAKLWEELRGLGLTSLGDIPLTVEACWKLIYDTWDVYAGLKRYRGEVANELRQNGQVRDFMGRRRFLPGAQLLGREWPMNTLRWEAERQGLNFKIQGFAAELLKRTMVTVWYELYPRLAGKLRFWLQVHDELMGQVREEHWEEINMAMIEAMTQDSWMLDPIRVETEGKMGASWAELK